MRPSPSWGCRQAVRLWRLVAACWVVSVVAWMPAMGVVWGAVGATLGQLPEYVGEIPEGDVELVLYQSFRGMAAPLELAVISGFAIMWAWTILWHAGLVNWALWAGERRVRLGEVLGLGVVSWWRYARLSLSAGAALLVTLLASLYPISTALESAMWGTSEARVTPLLSIGIVTAVVGVLVVWVATVRAAWLFGLPERRSAVFTWLLGLGGTLQSPFVSLGTLLVWGLPAVLISAVPLAVGITVPTLRDGWVIPIVGQLGSAVCAFCWVGLFASFAPVTGLVGVEEEDSDSESKGRGARD